MKCQTCGMLNPLQLQPHIESAAADRLQLDPERRQHLRPRRQHLRRRRRRVGQDALNRGEFGRGGLQQRRHCRHQGVPLRGLVEGGWGGGGWVGEGAGDCAGLANKLDEPLPRARLKVEIEGYEKEPHLAGHRGFQEFQNDVFEVDCGGDGLWTR
jgi:hypothetical protein